MREYIVKRTVKDKDNINQVLMEKIVDFWNFYIDMSRSPGVIYYKNEQEDMARFIHGIQGILAIRELKSKNDKLFK